MKKKFICTVCGYVHEGDAAPEKCPLCGAPASKFEELKEDGSLEFVTEHVIGVAKDTDDEMKKDLNAHFMGECTEVGMYLAMSRQADREGYPKSPKHSVATLLRKPTTHHASPSSSATSFGTQRPTSKSA